MESKRGRPPRDPNGEAAKIVPIRMTSTEREQFERAADKADVSLSEWIRGCLTRAAKRQSKDK